MVAKSHFDNCPYNCNAKGKILDVTARKLVDCPYCSKLKAQMLKQGLVETEEDEKLPLSKVLGIQNEYLTNKFVYEGIVPEGERLFIEEESLEYQKSVADELYLGLSIGNLPEESICFGVSIKGAVEQFAYPMLSKAYLAGLTIGKFMTCSEFARLSFDISNDLSDFYSSDFLMMMINDGSNLADISSAKGLMQTRALKGKPTVFITTWTIEACSGLLGYYDNSSLSLAKPVFLKYKTSKSKKSSSYINKLLGVENKDLSGEGVEDSGSGVSVSMSDLFNM